MSTPKLSNKHFASVAQSLVHFAIKARTASQSSNTAANICRAINVSPFGDDDQDVEAAIDGLVFDWQRVNCAAYATRYNKKRPDVSTLGRGDFLSLVATYKALQCVRYNCDGGESVGASLRKSLDVLEALLETLSDSIIAETDEYSSAEWFIG